MFNLDVLIFLFVAVTIIVSVISTVIGLIKKSGAVTSSKPHSHPSFGRQVDAMHVKDAGDERRHRLDQLASLYKAGMMERDEYEERVACVEADYAQRRY